MPELVREVEIRHAHFFCGLGGGAKGFNEGEARVGNTVAKFRCLGGIDVDPRAIENFNRLVKVPGTVLDLFDLDQYVAFHGKAPPPGWRPAEIADVHAAFNHERPHIVFLSAPCKGFSGLLAETTSKTAKYQALNKLTLRGVWLMLEAYKGDPPELIIFENVPRIATRGRHLLDQITALLRAYGYNVAETTHDCGEIGGLAQSRKRFLLVARHREKVPNFLYEPVKQRLKGVGEILDLLPLPGDERAGVMHRVPSLQWKTWVRLAFVEAGKDWRSLNTLRIGDDGNLLDFGIAPDWQAPMPVANVAPDEMYRSSLGVVDWRDPTGVIGGRGFPLNGAYSVADPRTADRDHDSTLGVRSWDEPAGTVQSKSGPTNGAFSVADPRHTPSSHEGGQLGVREWDQPAPTVIGNQRSPYQGGYSVADPRVDGHDKSVQLGVRRWDETAAVVTGKMFVGGGPNSVADPRLTGGPRFNSTYRIVAFGEPSPAVAGPGGPAGGLAVADPRTGYDDAHKNVLRVVDMGEVAPTVTAGARPSGGGLSVADPRTGFGPNSHRNKLAVVDWDQRAGAITGADRVGSGALSVADPRPGYPDGTHTSLYAVTAFDDPARSVTGAGHAAGGALSVADPRPSPRDDYKQTKYRVTGYDEAAGTVISASTTGNGAFSVADPRPEAFKGGRATWKGHEHYGVLSWDETAATVSGSACHDNGYGSVADPREILLEPTFALPAPNDRLVCRIIALDDTWHRPFTTFELAALQSLFDPEQWSEFALSGRSDAEWREQIGNAVPAGAARAVAGVMGRTLLKAWAGDSFELSADAIWVSPLEIALAVDTSSQEVRL